MEVTKVEINLEKEGGCAGEMRHKASDSNSKPRAFFLFSPKTCDYLIFFHFF